MARSMKPSLLKSPAARALPKSNGSAVSRPPPPWTSSWLPAPVRPVADPSRMVTAPARLGGADPLAGHPDGEVGKAVVVEVGFTATAAAAAAA